MHIHILRNLLILILLISWQSSFAQSIKDLNLEKLLIDNPSLINNIPQLKKSNIEENLISENQNVANTNNNLQIDLSKDIIQREIKEKSMLVRYFNTLVGKDLDIYGYNEFNQTQDDSLLFFNTIGKNYQLAPGDTIQITINGLSASNKNYQVMNDGTITLENLSPLFVNNLNLNQVNNLVLDEIRLDDASAEVFVRLNNARLVTVQISGNVKSPRTIAVPAYTPLSRVIAFSGGISDTGSLRNISLSQIGEATQAVDFYNFLQNASPKLDPLIKNGARIFIPFKGPTVAVTGFVNNPGIYELPNEKPEISIKNLLNITGTSFLPPGAKLKVSYFDASGQIATRLVSKNDSLKEGEALKIDFIETRDLNISKVSGAVLKDFEIKTNTALSIKEILKDGAVLSTDAFKSFALIVDKEVKVINIYEALENDNITLPVGSDLQLLTKEKYLALVALDPNKSLDPIASKFFNSNVAEIYLNGNRIAYIPVGQDIDFNKHIKAFYNPNPKTVYELALIERGLAVEAFDFRSAMQGNYNPKLDKGDRLYIFEDNFLKQLIHEEKDDISSDINTDDMFTDIDTIEQFEDTTTEYTDVSRNEKSGIELYKLQKESKTKKLAYSQTLEYSKKLLQKSNVIKISLDGELFSILPFVEGMTSANVLNKLRGRLPNLTNEFVIYQNNDLNLSPEIKNSNYEFKIKQNDFIGFISQDTYRRLINIYDTSDDSELLNDVRDSDVVKVYHDKKLTLLLPPYVPFSKQILFDNLIHSKNFYKLYIGFSTKQKNYNTWTFRSYNADTFFSNSQNIIPNKSNIVYTFSEKYIRDNFLDSFSREELLVNTSTTATDKNSFSEIERDATQEGRATQIDGLDKIDVLKNQDRDAELRQSNNNKNSDYVTKSMVSSLRYISGSVMFPGTYPVANKVKLKDLVEVAGLISTKASSDVILTRSINENGILIKSTPETYKLDSLSENETILTGEFYVEVPKAINTAINGFINLSGEFLVPGDYPFSSSENLEEIIQRAGGLSDSAYPLGAVLERKSIQVQEKTSNNILAGQLEASVLTLAQSDIQGVGDQIKAVLGFAQQLRNLPTTGRMTINIMDIDDNFYLQDGDKLMLPKRPSHVSVIGAVQRTTIANYNKNKTYKDYIMSAGGLTKMADIRKTYLLLPNGESRLLDNNTIIPAGSVVIIPPKIDRLSILGLSDIVSRVLGNIATSILAINNVN